MASRLESALERKSKTFDGKVLEHALQKAAVAWFRRTYPGLIIYHTANGGYRKDKEATNFKHMGVLKGVPDLCIPYLVKGHGALYIELKKPTEKAVFKGEQKFISDKLIQMGNEVAICNDLIDFKNIVNNYLGDCDVDFTKPTNNQ